MQGIITIDATNQKHMMQDKNNRFAMNCHHHKTQ
jgi:hypothetical protein